MRILMLSWEYPPRIVGGIARHVEELAWALAAQGEEVHVVTCEFPGAAPEETYKGVHIHRVTPYTPTDNFIHWVHQLNAAMRDRAEALLREWTAPTTDDGRRMTEGRRKKRAPSTLNPQPSTPVLLHAHDWLAYFSANELKHAFRVPLVATIHATEHGRNGGIRDDTQRYISGIEHRLCHEAWRVIVCSHFMKGEVAHVLQTPWDKMDVIANGIHAEKFDFPFPPEEAAALRAQYAAPEEKLIFFVGRGTHEKGAHVLIDALPKVRAQYHDAKLLIAGGGYKEHLKQQAEALGVARHVYFTGFVPDDTLLRLYKTIDVACYPSLYEPFGIVALEAMAAGVPVVVSDAGGLKEVIENEVSGLTTYAGDSGSLAHGIVRVLKDPAHARWMADNAKERVRDLFNWDRIAAETRHTYERVWTEYEESEWGRLRDEG